MNKPLNLGMALERNPAAMAKYDSLTEYERQAVADWANNCATSGELEQLINNLAEE